MLCPSVEFDYSALCITKQAGKIFFSNLEGFSSFFPRSAKRTSVLDEVVKKRLPKYSAARWNFKARCVTTIFVHKDDIAACLERIIDDDSSDESTLRKALGLKNILRDNDFNFWLYLFHKIMPNCDILFNQLQQREIDCVKAELYVSLFKMSIQNIRNTIDEDNYMSNENYYNSQTKRGRFCDSKSSAAKEVCDVILSNIDDRFAFTDQLSIALLFQTNLFLKHQAVFPENEYKVALQYNVNAAALRSELTVLYNRQDFSNASGALTLLDCFQVNNLLSVFPECVKLLRIICTTPMTTAESERCFSTLKRIKTFTRNTMKEDRLCALGMCSIEKNLLQTTNNFNDLVIDHFAQQKERRMDFMFKQIN